MMIAFLLKDLTAIRMKIRAPRNEKNYTWNEGIDDPNDTPLR